MKTTMQKPKLHNITCTADQLELPHVSGKPYVVLFSRWGGKSMKTITDAIGFDSIEDAQEELSLIETMYRGTVRPVKDTEKMKQPGCDRRCVCANTPGMYKYEGDSFFYGYALIDRQAQKVRFFKDGIRVRSHSAQDPGYHILSEKSNQLLLKDIFFRPEGIVPEGYVWNFPYEYSAWLDFKYGNKEQKQQKPRLKPVIIEDEIV